MGRFAISDSIKFDLYHEQSRSTFVVERRIDRNLFSFTFEDI